MLGDYIRPTVGYITLCSLLTLTLGCVSVKAPERIEIKTDRRESVDVQHVPQTTTHEEAQTELVKAYQTLAHLERENERLERKAAEYKSERDQCRRDLETLQDED